MIFTAKEILEKQHKIIKEKYANNEVFKIIFQKIQDRLYVTTDSSIIIYKNGDPILYRNILGYSFELKILGYIVECEYDHIKISWN